MKTVEPDATVRPVDPEGSSRLIVILAAVALIPLVVAFPAMVKLFWFGDDWGLLADYVDIGMERWLLQPFAENFAPLFKLTWVEAVTVSHGSYLEMILILWVSHVANLILFGVLVRRSGLSPVATAAALLAFGLSWTNLESLAWSPQLSQLVSVTFFLLAWVVWKSVEGQSGPQILGIALIWVCLLSSSLFFSRGVIGGIVLALYAAGEWIVDRRHPIRRDLILASLATSAIAFGVTLHFSASELERLGDAGPRAILAMAIYAVSYLTLNPLLLLLHLPWQEMGVSTLTSVPANGVTRGFNGSALVLAFLAIAIALAKLAIVAFAVARSNNRTRLILLALLAFDVVNAVLLGVGRYQTGLGTVVSSRYQYVSWLGFALCLGIAFQSAVNVAARRVRRVRGVSRLVPLTAFAILVSIIAFPWPSEAGKWADWRGTAIQQELRDGSANARLSYSQITIGRARQLETLFALH